MKVRNFILIVTIVSSGALADPTDQSLVEAAFERTTHAVRYDGSYYAIPYPDGDVPSDVGVCTDVVIRAYRSLRNKICNGLFTRTWQRILTSIHQSEFGD